MNHRRLTQQSTTRRDPERGASLILALAVMVAISGVLSGLAYFISTSTKSSERLEDTRNELYAADGAVETAIRAVQRNSNGLIGTTCPTGVTSPFTANGKTIYVTCVGDPASSLSGTQVVIQRNVIITACNAAGCPAGSIVIRAKVNFPTNAAGVVTGAFVQSWSVSP